MKRIKQLLFVLILGLLISPFFTLVKAENQIDIHFFHSDYCEHCQDMEEFLQGLELEYDNINIIYYEVNDIDNYYLFKQVLTVFDADSLIPTVIIGGIYFVGFNDQVQIDIEKTIERYSDSDFVDIVDKIQSGEEILITDFDTLIRDTIKLPFIGVVEIKSMSLFLAAVVLGFVDGFNPCAMWVLIFLISMLVNMRNKKRMWAIGFTFLFTSAFVYFLIMISWLGIAVSIVQVNWLRSLIGLIAIGFGGYNIYKYQKNKRAETGCDVTTTKQRSKLMERIRNIVKKRNLILALLGVVALAITVNLIELACSAGLPLLFTQILAYNELTTGAYFFYIGVYILLFLIDDLVIFTIAMITMKVTGISNKYSNYSTIIGGIIMLIIGFLLIFFPSIIMFNF